MSVHVHSFCPYTMNKTFKNTMPLLRKLGDDSQTICQRKISQEHSLHNWYLSSVTCYQWYFSVIDDNFDVWLSHLWGVSYNPSNVTSLSCWANILIPVPSTTSKYIYKYTFYNIIQFGQGLPFFIHTCTCQMGNIYISPIIAQQATGCTDINDINAVSKWPIN